MDFLFSVKKETLCQISATTHAESSVNACNRQIVIVYAIWLSCIIKTVFVYCLTFSLFSYLFVYIAKSTSVDEATQSILRNEILGQLWKFVEIIHGLTLGEISCVRTYGQTKNSSTAKKSILSSVKFKFVQIRLELIVRQNLCPLGYFCNHWKIRLTD